MEALERPRATRTARPAHTDIAGEESLPTLAEAIAVAISNAPARGSHERIALWYDVNLSADSWFNRPRVEAQQAALLLCGFNPDEMTVEDALGQSDEHTGPEDLRRLLGELGSHAARDGRARALLDWHDLAVQAGTGLRPWVGEYLQARERLGAPVRAAVARRVRSNKEHFTPAQKADIACRVRDGESVKALAREFGVARPTIDRAIQSDKKLHGMKGSSVFHQR